MDPDRHFDAEDVSRYEALQVADLEVHHRGVPEMLTQLAQRLRKVASFEVASFALYDPEKKVMRLHFWEGSDRLSDLAQLTVEESACGFGWDKPTILPDLKQETHFQAAVNILRESLARWDWEATGPTPIAMRMCSFCGKLPNWSLWVWKTRIPESPFAKRRNGWKCCSKSVRH
jgi:hypothetical protein